MSRYPDQLFRKTLQTYRLFTANVEYLTIGSFAGSREQQSINDIIDVIQIAPLSAFAEQFDDAPINRLPGEPSDKALPIMAHKLARAVGVRQAQADGAQTVETMVQQMIILGGKFVDAVDVGRRDAMRFINRQVKGLAVNLSRAGENDFDVRIKVTTSFKQRELRRTIEF